MLTEKDIAEIRERAQDYIWPSPATQMGQTDIPALIDTIEAFAKALDKLRDECVQDREAYHQSISLEAQVEITRQFLVTYHGEAT